MILHHVVYTCILHDVEWSDTYGRYQNGACRDAVCGDHLGT